MTAELDIPLLQQHADILSSLQGPEKLRLAILRAGGHGVKKSVRHALVLMRDHAGKLADHPALHPEEQAHMADIHRHFQEMPRHIRKIVDNFIQDGPLGDAGHRWRDLVNAHRDAQGGSWFTRAWHKVKHGISGAAKVVYKTVAKPVGKALLGEAEKVGKSLLRQVEKDPIGTAKTVAAAMA